MKKQRIEIMNLTNIEDAYSMLSRQSLQIIIDHILHCFGLTRTFSHLMQRSFWGTGLTNLWVSIPILLKKEGD